MRLEEETASPTRAYLIRVSGVVQGVGFRPFVYRLACANRLAGWVLNGEEGVEIYLEGSELRLQSFVESLRTEAPPAARIVDVEVTLALPRGVRGFTIRESERRERPTVRISPDLPVCDECLSELFDRANRRYLYPYINCTNCGPRYTVVLGLPYDRPATTMKDWALDEYCAAEYGNPGNRRFHAQPVACPECGPKYYLQGASTDGGGAVLGDSGIEIKQSIRVAAELLNAGKVVAIKGLGGYHLACDARNAASVAALRERKFRKEKPFALMVRDLDRARGLVELSVEAEELLTSTARPIVLAPAKHDLGGLDFAGVAPENDELGVMLPHTPLQHLLFAAGAPAVLVMTSANRSSEPIAYEDADARQRLSGIADAFLVGERPIARRVDDSVARAGVLGPVILRRGRGYAPGAVAQLPVERLLGVPSGTRPILALGADLKNAITLVVEGQAFVSQYIGDLEHAEAFRAFRETIDDLIEMYEVSWDDVLVVHDAHPQYVSTAHVGALAGKHVLAVQHHRAHIASVLAERGEFEKRVLGVSFDGTGYGDDGSIWGGEFFVGSVGEGFERIAHLRTSVLAGGDASARHPVQAAAGFLSQLDGLEELSAAPFYFPGRYRSAVQLVRKNVRTFPTTSVGRLFDTAAALLGFTREITFEGQAAMWLEQMARRAPDVEAYAFPFEGGELDFRPLLGAVVRDRVAGRGVAEVARAFQRGIAEGLRDAILTLSKVHGLDTVVLSGGVFQNELLLRDVKRAMEHDSIGIWINHAVPPNDGGISLGQAALAACALRRGKQTEGAIE
jgi:hydrogenase maturation protein HypF